MAKPSVGTIKGIHIGIDEVAELFGVARDSVTRYVRDDGMPKSSWGKYPAFEVIRWYLERQTQGGTGSKQLEDTRKRLLEEQITKARMENDKERGALLEYGAVSSSVRAVFAAIATQLRGLAPRNAARLSTLDDPAVIQRVLADEIRNILTSAAGEVAAFAVVLGDGADTDAPAPKKRRTMGRRAPNTPSGSPGAGAVAD